MTDRRVLGDRYEIESMLGRGGMATVYRGRDRVLDRPVAIKVLAGKYAGDEKFVTRFQREARAAAGLNHRTIVSVYDTGDTDGEHYFVMELVQGETLGDLLAREGPLAPERAARIAAGIAEALQAAHDQGLIHRDVKPGNVMLTPGGEVKVMDFGIARAATDDTLTQTGLILGTASYLSPEQSRGDPVDHRSDIYSLGCVVYEMLAGRPPFSADTPLSVAYKHVNDEPRPPSRANPSIPPEMEAVAMRALVKDPEARFPTANAFRQAITSAAGGEATEPLGGDTAVLPAADTERLSAPPPTRRALIPLGLVAAVLLVAGVVALAMAGADEKPRGERRERQQQRAERSPSPTPVVTTPAVLGVEDAAAAFQELVADSREAGLLSEEVALEALEDQQDATDAYAAGDQEAALEHLDDADSDIESALAAGGVASPGAAVTLHEGIDAIRQAMLAAPAQSVEDQEEEDGEDEGGDGDQGEDAPGNSENAPGHVKKDKDDD